MCREMCREMCRDTFGAMRYCCNALNVSFAKDTSFPSDTNFHRILPGGILIYDDNTLYFIGQKCTGKIKTQMCR